MTTLPDVGVGVTCIVERAECAYCDRMFASQRGLSQHVRLAHPNEYQANISLSQSASIGRKRWTDDERNALALLEVEANFPSTASAAEIGRCLAGKHGARSFESIKAERRGVRYNSIRTAIVQSRLIVGAPDSTTAMPSVVMGEGHSEVDSSATKQCTHTAVSSNVEVVQNGNEEPHVEYDPSLDIREAIVNGINFIETKRKFLARDLVLGAQAVLANRDDLGQLMKWFADVSQGKVTKRRQGPKGTVRGSTRQRVQIRTEYAKLQALFRKAPKKAAKYILEGDVNAQSGPKGKAMFRFWENVFGKEGFAHSESVESATPSVSEENVRTISGPIEANELANSKPKRGTAAGPDGLTSTRWRVIPTEWKQLFYNCLLYANSTPSELVAARTVFIPKKDKPLLPGDYRPISVTSVALRQFHTILARRLQHAFAHDERQRAFQCSVDGAAENVFLLNAILRDARDNKKELHLVSLDLNKAFDSVNHNGIFSTLKHLGCPTRFINHVKRVYSVAATNFQYGGQEYYARVKTGVLQGDPMSPILFNYVIDRVLACLNNSLGYSLGDSRICAIAFADDIVLVSGSVLGLQMNLDKAVTSLKTFGLTINMGKTAALSYRGYSRNGSRVMSPSAEELFTIGTVTIRQLGSADEWRYLGIDFQGIACCRVTSRGLTSDIQRVSKAKLKPQQKLLLLRQFVLPKQLQKLVLGTTSQTLLRDLDKVTRKFTRKWLHMPNDVPKSYVHGAHRYGGLGVSSLSLDVPRMRLARIQKFINQDSELARAFASSNLAKKQVRACTTGLEKGGILSATKMGIADFWKDQLNSKIDTAGLSGGDPVSHKWLSGYNMSGGDFVKLNHVRVGCIPTVARLARGRADVINMRCRNGCAASETNYHVIQQCESSGGGRRFRHNAIVKLMSSALKNRANGVHVEPRFNSMEGLRIPDLIAVKGGHAWVMDVQVVKDDKLDQYHATKRSKYQSCRGLDELIMRRYLCARVTHLPITVSYKGVIQCETASVLRKHFGISDATLGRMTLVTLKFGYRNWTSLRARYR